MPTAPYRFRPYFYPRPPRGGRPLSHSPLCHEVHNFYPRPPRGGRPTSISVAFAFLRFLSTPSARRATGKVRRENRPLRNFYPRPPRGGRQRALVAVPVGILFLSTPSARRATNPCCSIGNALSISIHALREEGDCPAWPGFCGCCYFYPRPPRGGRRLRSSKARYFSNFYPRPPRGGRHITAGRR